MIVFLLKAIFSSFSILLNLASRLLFTTVAYFLIWAIQAFRVPGHALQGALQWLGEGIKGVIESILLLLVEIVSSLVSTVFDVVKGGILGSIEATSSGLTTLMEQMKASLEGLFNEGPELVQGLAELAWKVLADLWENYKEALGYVTGNS